MTAPSASDRNQSIPEDNFSDYSVAALRFADLGDREYGTRQLEHMLSAIRLVRGSGWRLPPQVQADLQLRLYDLFKTIADKIADFQDQFRQTQIAQQEERKR